MLISQKPAQTLSKHEAVNELKWSVYNLTHLLLSLQVKDNKAAATATASTAQARITDRRNGDVKQGQLSTKHTCNAP